ncbi:TatD family hydrolase [Winogradskyella aurantiaca]|uniref:TatD family hydrolase n=1 Tax=Winogradskyella aurantiaca TaxID=2219558 RepID=UPI000E1E0BEA|nr:TatD family hydrolase [Winogradskyella aurantiaca]
MTITDTHTHLYIEDFEQDIDAVIERAKSKGVTRFFLPAIDSTYSKAMLDLKERYPDEVFLMTGLHPTHVKENYKLELSHVENNLKISAYHAIGEIGIDLYWDKTTLEIQKKAFRYQIQLAKSYGLPIVIHCREAFSEIFEVLESERSEDLFGIFHCFTGTLDDANKAIDLGFKLGIGGVVTFKNGKIDKFLDQIDLEHIVLETDAPYLAPVPFRGKRNESSYLSFILEKLETIYKIPISEIAKITTANSVKIFKV